MPLDTRRDTRSALSARQRHGLGSQPTDADTCVVEGFWGAQVTVRFNPPPNWPTPPAGWTPPEGWQPDPSWPPAPDGWQFWIEDPPPVPRSGVRR